jgi:hypothetical protein
MEANHSRQTALKHAVDEGKMGGIAAPHEELILEYYNDVHEHVIESFRSAKRVAWIGFSVLIGTLQFDRTGMPPNHLGANERASGRLGVVAREAHR